MPNHNLIKETLQELDSQPLEDYFPSEKEGVLGKSIGKLREAKDADAEQYLQMEWMLLNNVCGFVGIISDKWGHLLEQDELGRKPEFWLYNNEVTNYFQERKKDKLPSLTSARINYYLWTATKDFEFAKASISDFEAAMEEHGKSGDPTYTRTSVFCGKFALKMMASFGQTELIEKDFLPKVCTLTGETTNAYLRRELVPLGFKCIKVIQKSDKSKGLIEASAFVDMCKKNIQEMIDAGNYDLAVVWIELLENYAKEAEDDALYHDIQKQHLQMIIADAERRPSALLKTSFYQAALTYYQKMDEKDAAVEQKLKTALAENMEKSVPEFKTVQAPFSVPLEKIDSVLEQFCKDADNRERILCLSEIIIPSREAVLRMAETKSTGLVSLFSKVVQTKDHISKTYTTEKEKTRYETLTAFVPIMQMNEMYHSRAIEKYGINAQDFIGLVEEAHLPITTKELLKRAIERYFAEDYMSSLHLSCPQIEELLRHLIRTHGGETVAFDKKTRTINQDLLASLVRDEMVKNVLGPDSCDAIDSFYANPDSYNLRNKISHGLADMKDFNRKNSMITIFVIMHIILKMAQATVVE